jgi:hypothetical protein
MIVEGVLPSVKSTTNVFIVVVALLKIRLFLKLKTKLLPVIKSFKGAIALIFLPINEGRPVTATNFSVLWLKVTPPLLGISSLKFSL